MGGRHAPTGTFAGGIKVGPATASRPPGDADGKHVPDGQVAMRCCSHPASETPTGAACTQVWEPPGDRQVEFTGIAQINRDNVDAITAAAAGAHRDRRGDVGLMFLLTGSVVLPVKAWS